MKIRAARADDAAAVASIHIGSRQRHVAFAGFAHSEAEIRAWVREVVIPRGRVWVLEENGTVAAFVALSINEGAGWIEQLYVHPDLTGRGYGTALLAVAKRELPAPIFLHTFQQNQGARRFYERAGFVAEKFTDGSQNEERCPDVLYRWDGAVTQKLPHE